MCTRVCTLAFFNISTLEFPGLLQVHFLPGGTHPRDTTYVHVNIFGQYWCFLPGLQFLRGYKKCTCGCTHRDFWHFDHTVHCFAPWSFLHGWSPWGSWSCKRTIFFWTTILTLFYIHGIHEATKICAWVYTPLFFNLLSLYLSIFICVHFLSVCTPRGPYGCIRKRLWDQKNVINDVYPGVFKNSTRYLYVLFRAHFLCIYVYRQYYTCTYKSFLYNIYTFLRAHRLYEILQAHTYYRYQWFSKI